METARKQTLEDWVVGIGFRYRAEQLRPDWYFVTFILRGRGVSFEFFSPNNPPRMLNVLQHELEMGYVDAADCQEYPFIHFLYGVLNESEMEKFWNINKT